MSYIFYEALFCADDTILLSGSVLKLQAMLDIIMCIIDRCLQTNYG